MYLLSEAWFLWSAVQKHPCWKQRAAYRRHYSWIQQGYVDDRLHRSKPWAFWRTPTELAHVPQNNACCRRRLTNGETYGLPWPCWEQPRNETPGYSRKTSFTMMKNPVAEGGGNFRTRFPVWSSRKVKAFVAEDSYTRKAAKSKRLPRIPVTNFHREQLGWWDDLTAEEKASAEGKNWKTTFLVVSSVWLSKHGCIPFERTKSTCDCLDIPRPRTSTPWTTLHATSWSCCWLPNLGR